MATLTELHGAIRARDVAQVKAMLASAPGLAQERPAGAPSPMLFAAYVGAAEVVAVLRTVVPLDVPEAAALGDMDRLHALLGADPAHAQARSGDGWPALHLAGFFGRREAVALLLQRGASVSAVSGTPDRNQALQASLAGACDPDIIALLLTAGADVNHAGVNGYTPLHTAASRGNEALVRLLVARGASVGATMSDGKTAAHIAAERGHAAVRDVLQALADGSAGA